jgi:DNA polymerase-3 subunit delta
MTIFFYGPNIYSLRQQLGHMVQTYKGKAGSDFGLDRIDGAVVTANQLMASLQASPFLATSRLVIVENVALNKSVAEKLGQLLERVPASTVAVFVEREIDRRTTAFRVLSSADKVVKFDQLSRPKLLGWVRAEIIRLGGTAEDAAVRELVDLAGEDQWRLAEEANKLVNYNPEVTVDSIRALVTPDSWQSVFEMVEAMTAGHVSAALSGYHALLGRRESEIYVLTMVQWQLRNLLLATTAPDLSPAELAEAAGMSPYVAGKMMAARTSMSEEVLRRSYGAAADCEYNIKTGQVKAPVAVEQLIYQLASNAKAK